MYEKIWESKTIHNETTVIIKMNDGESYGTLLYAPTKVISVRDYTLNKEYDPSEYTVVGKKIIPTATSTMPFLTENNFKGEDLPDTIGTYDDGKGGKIPFSEGIGIIMYQIAITYEHEDSWDGAIPASQIDKLPRFKEKLANKEKMNIVFNGDSIETGCNASSVLGVAPFQDDWPTGLVNELTRRHEGIELVKTNTSVGGTLSNWGRDNVDNNVNHYSPDLAILGFGMNDGSWNISSSDFIDNIDFMIRSIRARKPEAEIILIATIVANPSSAQNKGQAGYLKPLQNLALEYDGVAVLDMTSFSETLNAHKRSVDFYANNINHPSDFLVRSYVANLLTLLGE